jgi:hypothetical protein
MSIPQPFPGSLISRGITVILTSVVDTSESNVISTHDNSLTKPNDGCYLLPAFLTRFA